MTDSDLLTLKSAHRFIRINAVHQADKDLARELEAWIEREQVRETEPQTSSLELSP